MKKVGFFLLLAVAAAAFMAVQADEASARPAYNKVFLAKHKAAGFKAAKCYLCHAKAVSTDPKDKVSKKDRNEYGLALSKYITGDDYKKENAKDKAIADKEKRVNVTNKFLEAYEKAGKDKSSSGKTFAEKIKADELPAASTDKVE